MSTRAPRRTAASASTGGDRPSLPWPLVETALRHGLATMAPDLAVMDGLSTVVTRRRNQEPVTKQLEALMRPQMRHLYETAPSMEKTMIEQVAELTKERVNNPEYAAWTCAFDALLLRYRRSRAPTSSAIPPLKKANQQWVDNRKMEARIRFAAISKEEREELAQNMKDLELYFEREFKAGNGVTFEGIKKVARQYGAFDPHSPDEDQQGHAHGYEQVQHSFHPEAGEVEVLKAERSLRKRRERTMAAAAERARAASEREKEQEQPQQEQQVMADEDDLKPNLAHWLKLQREKGAIPTTSGDRLPTPATSAASVVAGTPPLPSPSFPSHPARPPIPSETPPRPKKRPRTPSSAADTPFPPLPDHYDSLPSSLSSLLHPLHLSNLPSSEITSRQSLTDRLFPPSLKPDASILYKPDETSGGIARTAFVGFLDPEKRIEAMQHAVQVRLGRWDVKAELVEAGDKVKKAEWEWADIANEGIKERLWRMECERIREAERVELQADSGGGEGAVGVARAYARDLGEGDQEDEEEDEEDEEDESLLVPPDDTSPVIPQEELPAIDEAGTPPRPVPSGLAQPSARHCPALSYASAISLTAPAFGTSPAPHDRPATRDSSPRPQGEDDFIVLDEDLPPPAVPSRPPSNASSARPSPAPTPPTGPSANRRRPSAPRRTPSSSSFVAISATPAFPAAPPPSGPAKPPQPTLLARTTAIEVHGAAGGGTASPPSGPGAGKKVQKRAAERAVSGPRGGASAESAGGGGISLLARLGGGAEEGEPMQKKQKKSGEREDHHPHSHAHTSARPSSSSSASPAPSPAAAPQRGGHAAARGRGRGRGAGPGLAFHPPAPPGPPASSSSTALRFPQALQAEGRAVTSGKGKGPPPAFLPAGPIESSGADRGWVKSGRAIRLGWGSCAYEDD
ncbi:hypothetical protein JCM11251_003968 [Rhodosporidiobolus azoricus]